MYGGRFPRIRKDHRKRCSISAQKFWGRRSGETKHGSRKGFARIWTAAMVLMFFFGFFCMSCAMQKEPLEQRLEKVENIRGAEAEGVIDSISEKKDQTRYILLDAMIWIPEKDGETSTFCSEKVFVTMKTSDQDGISDPVGCVIEPGETVRFCGKLTLFEEPTNPGQFDFKRYYRGLGIRYRFQADSAEQLDAENECSPAELAAYRIKKRAERAIDDTCVPEDRGFFRAILLGDRGMLSEEDANLFREGGISHILAVSGLHVSLIGMTIYTVLRRMGAGYGAAGAAAGILLLIYGTIAGFGASVFRAVFMTCLGMGANFIGRTYDRMSAMALALLLLLVQSPFLLYSAGVQLSFGAILAISVLADRDRRRKRAEMLEEKNRNRDRERERHRNGEKRNAAVAFGWFPGKGTGSGTEEEKGSCGAETGQYADRIREVFRMNAAIQLFTLPVILRNYFTYPAVGLLLNLVVIPLMAFAAASGFFGAGICALGIPVFAGAGIGAKGIAALTGAVMAPGHYIYHFYRLLCGIARMAAFLQITPGSPSDLTACGYYVLIFAAFYGDEISNKAVLVCKWGFINITGGKTINAVSELADRMRASLVRMQRMGWEKDRKETYKTEWFVRKTSLGPLFIGIALCMMFIRQPLSGLEATFLDVRQGECLVLRYGDHAWISDCGSTQDKNVGENRLVPFLKSKGVTRVDAAFVSHPDADHVNGIMYLLEEDTGISVGKLVLPTAAVCSERYDSLKENAEKAEVPVEYMEAGAGFEEGDVRLRCIHPLVGEKLDAADPNEHCLAFEVSCENLKMVLTADLPGEHEKEIVGRLTAKANRDAGSIAGGGKTEPVIILKAGHHGSATSTSEDLLNAVKPDLVVISCGRHNRYGHPAPEAMERIRKSGAKILDTEYDGAITVRSDGEKVRAETFCAQKSRDSGSRDKEGEG
ncbi:ComEC/Rec2 family competence protein [[Clostridium] aminophilum]|uniref:ComEC/Rec2 family competence protein n=1 Tax=[Clostridium] aminophilum TaxID=1526 RepID=UPI00331C7EEA